jgi:hypothetical protein
MSSGRFYMEVLKAVRKVGSKRPKFTSFNVADEAGIDQRVAATYLARFVRWGFVHRLLDETEESPVIRKGGKQGDKHAWRRLFELTDRGATYKPQDLKCPKCGETGPLTKFWA